MGWAEGGAMDRGWSDGQGAERWTGEERWTGVE